MRFAPNLKKYLILIGFLFALIALPTLFVEKMRTKIFRLICPVSSTLHGLRGSDQIGKKYKALEIENHFLRREIAKYKSAFSEAEKSKVIAAQVIYRDPLSWSSTLWIDKGEEWNKKAKKKVIIKNCPVVYGKSVVGVIDFVGLKHSRVRLITDSALKISVRAVRGQIQHAKMVEHIDALTRLIDTHKEIALSPEEKKGLLQRLEKLKTSYRQDQLTFYLAKGLIQGSGHPLWRQKNTLHGQGFNYDFADLKGPSREIQTGKPCDKNLSPSSEALIQLHDFLMTTGMDGVFPEGLLVGQVTKIFPLREGAYTYDIEATPAVSHMDELKSVFILPSFDFEQNLPF